MLSLGVNCIVSPGEGSWLLKKPIRVLGIKDDFVLVIELGTNPSKPWRVERSLLAEEIDNGAAAINPEMVPMHLLRSDDEISKNEKNSREKNWALVRGLVEDKVPFDILTSNFGALVANHAMLMGVDRKQIYRLLYRYWSMGQTRNAFLWNTSACGGRGKEKSRASGIVPGRPLKYRGLVVDDGGAILLEARHMAHIRLAYGRVASGRCGNLKKAYEWMLNKFYRSIKPDGSKGNLIRGSYPSIHQLDHHGKLFFDELYKLKTRGGAIRYNKDHRPLVGSASQGLVGAGHRCDSDPNS